MIKKLFLNILSKKASPSPVEPVGFNRATKIGIIANSEESDLNNQIIQELEDLGKSVRMVSFIQNFDKKIAYPPQTFSSKDIGTTGSILSDDLLYFCKQKYDFLLSFDQTENRIFKYLLSITEANHKIGFHQVQLEGILDLMVIPKTNHPIEELIKYTKMIHHG